MRRRRRRRRAGAGRRHGGGADRLVVARRRRQLRPGPPLGVLPGPGVRRGGSRLDLRRGLLGRSPAPGERPQAPLLLRRRDGRPCARRGRRRRLGLSRRLGDRLSRRLLPRHDRSGRRRGSPRGVDLPRLGPRGHADPLRDVRAASRRHRRMAPRALGGAGLVFPAPAHPSSRAGRLRPQGGRDSAPRLASGGARGGPEPRLGAALGRRPEDGDLRSRSRADDAAGLSDLARARARGPRGRVRHPRRRHGARAARPQAPPRLPQHREHRHHPDRARRWRARDGEAPARLGRARVRGRPPSRLEPRGVQIAPLLFGRRRDPRDRDP